MGKGVSVGAIFKPLDSGLKYQNFLGVGLHTLGLLIWILEQIGKADVWVTTFSTSDAFLSGFYRLKQRCLIGHSMLLADLKASKKTVKLNKLMNTCFDDVYLGMNHSKILLVQNDKWMISSISSQNQTYGDRAECTMLSTDILCFNRLKHDLDKLLAEKSRLMNGVLERFT